MRARACAVLTALLSGSAFGQTTEPAPKFEIADVHPSPKTTTRFLFRRAGPARGGRYEVKTATMVDLISIAYGFGDDKVLGGPSWLEMDRFDVIGKVPADSTPETQKQMLQSLLADRFGLVVHKETKPLPTYALVAGKKPLLKQADGTGETGCKPETASGPPTEGGIRLMTAGPNGAATTINLGPGATIQFHCHNMSMAAFAEGLRGMMGAGAAVGTNPLLDQTGLEGRWNFDIKWSMGFMGPMMNQGDRITVFEAIEKQLGLKLEQRQVPTPVIVVDSVNRAPSENPPGVAEALPPIPPPSEFEVADVKASGPGRMGGFRLQPGGRLTATGMPMRLFLMRAFDTINSGSELVGAPSWADTERFDITAKAPAADPGAPALDIFSIAPMLRSLLAERFGLKYHTEERPQTAYSLVAAKPKLKKADPESRTWCKQPQPPPGAPPATRVLTCQNATMAEFAEQLQNLSQELSWPVLDATGVEGRWDLTLTFTQNFGMMMGGPGRGGDGGPPGGDLPSASDPSGGITIFQAMEKQLGLKLEMQKRSLPVIVIDHLDQKPTDN